jgi:type IV pilus assembly protein PilW
LKTAAHPSSHRGHQPRRRQQGLTLVELLVSLGLGLLVISIAAAFLVLGQQGYQTVDQTTMLRDKQRLTVDLLTRTILQAGFEDFGAVNATFRAGAKSTTTATPEPDIFGWNNAVYSTLTGLNFSEMTTIADGGRSSACGGVTDTSCRNGSDILLVRYQGVPDPADATKSDSSMVNCGGWGEPGLTNGDLNGRGVSIFHVARNATSGQPSLMCTYYNHSTGQWVDSTPLVEGVESLQVLYGTDRVTPNAPPTLNDPLQDTIPERWLRADQLTVTSGIGTAAQRIVQTRENWRRVRAVRIGLVLRGPVGSAQQSVTATMAPLGTAYTNATNDVGSSLTVAADGRLRIPVNFTVHVRNDMTTRN